jgi:transcriptional activator HAC1
MDSWDATTPSPNLKFENSPAESFLSTPGDMYPPLFNASSGSTMNPLEMMTPQPVEVEDEADAAALADLTLPEIPDSPEESGDKKPVKKRKSWGQVLPEPKTNLPPRYIRTLPWYNPSCPR